MVRSLVRVACVACLCACNAKPDPRIDASAVDASAKDEWKNWPFRALDNSRPPPPAPPQPSAEELAARKAAQEALDWAQYSELAWLDPQTRLQNGVAAALRAYHQRPAIIEWPPFAEALIALAAVVSSLDYSAPSQRINRADTVLSGHTGPVNLARFSPDGQRVLTVSADKTARLWDAATGRELVRYTGHSASVDYAAFSHDCLRIVTASKDGTARVWDVTSGRSISILSGLNAPVVFATFLPDGRHIVSESADHTVILWDGDTSAALSALDHMAFGLSERSLSPDGTRVVAAAGWGTVRIWDVSTGTTLANLDSKPPQLFANQATYSEDGSRIVAGSTHDNLASIWDAASLRLIMKVQGVTGPEADSARDRDVPVMKAQFSPDGTRLVTGRIFWCCASDLVWLWDAETGKIIAELMGPRVPLRSEMFSRDAYVSNVAFSPDSQLLAAGFSDGSTQIASAITGKLIATIRNPFDRDAFDREHRVDSALHVEFSPLGHRIITAFVDGQARIWPSTIDESLRLICQRVHESASQIPTRFRDLPGLCRERTVTRR